MTIQQAVSEGYTHYGSYYGIKVYMRNVDTQDDLVIETEYEMLGSLIPYIGAVEMFFQSLYKPDDELGFNFVVYGELPKPLRGECPKS